MHYYLVTTYNHGSYFRAMLSSIMEQYECLTEFERQARVFVLDDASTDNTAALLHSVQLEFPECVFVHVNRHNRGIGFNRNFLLNWLNTCALGPADVVSFVDGDDILPKSSVQARLRALEAEPALQCVGGQLAVFFGDDTKVLSRVDTFPLDPDIQAIANIFECHFYVSNALFRAEVFKDPTIRFPETPTSEDWLFFATHPLRKRHVPDVTLHYRRHQNNLTSVLSDGALVADIRRQARIASLLRIGVLPTQNECELMDLVSYLSFQMRWQGTGMTPSPRVEMPWFQKLKNRQGIEQAWPALRDELSRFLEAVALHNDRIPAFHGVKLRAYFAALMELADKEMAAGRTQPEPSGHPSQGPIKASSSKCSPVHSDSAPR